MGDEQSLWSQRHIYIGYYLIDTDQRPSKELPVGPGLQLAFSPSPASLCTTGIPLNIKHCAFLTMSLLANSVDRLLTGAPLREACLGTNIDMRTTSKFML